MILNQEPVQIFKIKTITTLVSYQNGVLKRQSMLSVFSSMDVLRFCYKRLFSLSILQYFQTVISLFFEWIVFFPVATGCFLSEILSSNTLSQAHDLHIKFLFIWIAVRQRSSQAKTNTKRETRKIVKYWIRSFSKCGLYSKEIDYSH